MTTRFVASPLGNTPQPELFELCALDAFLLRVEAEVRLLDRVRPRNAVRTLAKVRHSFLTGRPRPPQHPRFETPGFGELRRLLEHLARRLECAGP